MQIKYTPSDSDRKGGAITDALRDLELRQKTYREQALKIHPWVCAKCGREFSGKKLKELTVHHKDHNHDNNPPDGSNWELLCLYCHDNEHSRSLEAEWQDAPNSPAERKASATHNPFAKLQSLLSGNTKNQK
ncbi:MAG: YajD family HNH nuclease [Pseudomonadota bacterium]